MTKEQLKEFNGNDGKPAYIGYKGKVYDISKSDFWAGGTHMGRFKAGEDLTDSIDMSPHGEKNIFRFEVVDTLDDGTEKVADNDTVIPNAENMLSDMDKKMIAKRKWYRKNHPHPKLTHFPVGMFGFAFFVQVLACILGGVSGTFLANTSYIATVFGTIFLIPAIASGALSFYINYNGFTNSILKQKMIGSIILLITGVISIIIGNIELNSIGYFAGNSNSIITVFLQYNPLKSIYSVFTVINLAIVTFIASNGGKITWPQDKK